MDETSRSDRLRKAGATAWRTTVLVLATLLVALLFVGMGYLVYRGEISEGPFVLMTGVVLGYLLRAVHGYL
ncbi:hypothetical protein [Halorussus lipolyticus]|uniref:hypothetical protein n=1 Tax=Halorussus lipolyticus TaxID=3034024 RepID=UPI0023E87C37|nr:hypothetical protein [Halorussus sp. DT80]